MEKGDKKWYVSFLLVQSLAHFSALSYYVTDTHSIIAVLFLPLMFVQLVHHYYWQDGIKRHARTDTWTVIFKTRVASISPLIYIGIDLLLSNATNLWNPTLHATCFGHPQPSLGIKVHNLMPRCILRPKYGQGRLKHVEYRVWFNKFVFEGNT
jgi:hypothetical protein